LSTTFTWWISEKIDAEKRETFLKSGSGKRYIRKQLKKYFDKNSFLKVITEKAGTYCQ